MNSQFAKMCNVFRFTQMLWSIALIAESIIRVKSAPVLDPRIKGEIRDTFWDQQQISDMCEWGEFLNPGTKGCDKCSGHCKDGPDSKFCPSDCGAYLNWLEMKKMNKTDDEKSASPDIGHEESHSPIQKDNYVWVAWVVIIAVCVIAIIILIAKIMLLRKKIRKLTSISRQVQPNPAPQSSRCECMSHQPDNKQNAKNQSPHQQQDLPQPTENQPLIKQTAGGSEQQVPVMRNRQDLPKQTARRSVTVPKTFQASGDHQHENTPTTSDRRENRGVVSTLNLGITDESVNQ